MLSGQSSAEQVAALFSMHRRTMTRRLAASGLSFAALVDEGRFEISRQMLELTTLDVKQIARRWICGRKCLHSGVSSVERDNAVRMAVALQTITTRQVR